MADSFNKKEREKKRKKKRKDKAERKEQRKVESSRDERSLEDQFMYVDENGNLTSTPPDPSKKVKIKMEDIEISTPKKEDVPQQEVIRTGIVKFFNNEKGYGFINDSGSNESVFVHAAGLIDEIRDNDKVTFEIEMGHKGPNAVGVKLATDDDVQK